MGSHHDRPYDLYKDSPVRYLGYANEVGESLRGFIGPKWVNVSYLVASLYVFADTLDQTAKTFSRNSGKPRQLSKTAYAATDTLIWQMLASVVIPGFAINRVCAFSDYVLANNTKIVANNRKFIVTGIGLALIPFIIKPIDSLVDSMLDVTLRKIKP